MTAGVVVWLTGLPSSGKSTLARRLRERLQEAGRPCLLLDGDEVRAALTPAPGYDPAGREAFYTTLGRLAALLARQGMIVLVAATAHRRAYRDAARALAPRFVEVAVQATAEEVERRDDKGLYARVRRGEASGMPGVDLEYEPPVEPEVVALGGHDSAALHAVLRLVS